MSFTFHQQKEILEDDIDKSHWGELESESESEEESSSESEAEADDTGLVTPAEGCVLGDRISYLTHVILSRRCTENSCASCVCSGQCKNFRIMLFYLIR